MHEMQSNMDVPFHSFNFQSLKENSFFDIFCTQLKTSIRHTSYEKLEAVENYIYIYIYLNSRRTISETQEA